MKLSNSSNFWIKLRHWEYWPWWVVYIPVFVYWLWCGLKARAIFYLSAANPGFEYGGIIGSSKKAILDKIPYSILIVIAVLMILAPFRPMPHVLEKLIMLKNGTLTKPIDIFDMFYHLIPTIILSLKIYRSYAK